MPDEPGRLRIIGERGGTITEITEFLSDLENDAWPCTRSTNVGRPGVHRGGSPPKSGWSWVTRCGPWENRGTLASTARRFRRTRGSCLNTFASSRQASGSSWLRSIPSSKSGNTSMTVIGAGRMASSVMHRKRTISPRERADSKTDRRRSRSTWIEQAFKTSFMGRVHP